jgi:hypothetical protein
LEASKADVDTLAATDDKSQSLSTKVSNSDSDSYSNHTVQSLDLNFNKQGAVSFDNATGKYVAVDGSTVNATNNYTVMLADSAQANASGLNIVNAAGGMVSNGVNVARTSNMNSAPSINQVNSINQIR